MLDVDAFKGQHCSYEGEKNMKNRQLSKNFYLNEFTYSKTADKRVTPTDFQIDLLGRLAKNLLQPIRDKFGSLKITSGLRDREIYDALIKAGYPASKTSDHFLVPYLIYIDKKKDWYAPAWAPNPRGRGAVDFTLFNSTIFDIWDVWYWILNTFDRPGIDYNQVIIYPSGYSKVKGNYIHISNPSKLFKSKHIVPSRRPTMVYVAGNKKFRGYNFVSFDYFKNIMKTKFKERR